MKNNFRTCSVCHSEYKFCNKCREDADKPLWYFSFCSENCKNIYDTTSKFENGQTDANETKIQLNKLDLSKLDSFGTSYKNSISKIMDSVSVLVENVNNEIEETTVPTEDTLTENDIEVISEDKIETTNEVVEEKVLKKSRNKRAKIDVEE